MDNLYKPLHSLKTWPHIMYHFWFCYQSMQSGPFFLNYHQFQSKFTEGDTLLYTNACSVT